MKISRKNILLLLVFTIFLVLSLLVKTKVFPMVFILGILYLIASKIITQFKGKNIDFIIEMPGQVEKGENFLGEIRCINRGVFPVFATKAVIEVKNLLTEDSFQIEEPIDLLPKGKKNITIPLVENSCGQVEISVKNLLREDPLGIFRKYEQLEETVASKTFVAPSIKEIQFSNEEIEKYDMESYKFAENKVGSDPSETVGIREYMAGDKVKSIHWKLSSKMGDIVIREFGHPVENKILVLLDKKNYQGATAKSKTEVVELALSISNSLASREVSHNIGWYDSSDKSFISHKVVSNSDLNVVASQISSSPFFDKTSTEREFVESEGSKNYANFMYVTGEKESVEREMEVLGDYGYITAYRPENFKWKT